MTWSRHPRPLEDRLREKIELRPGSECWWFTGGTNKAGYGAIARGAPNPGQIGAHQAAYELWIGPLLEGHVICHRCDNPSCVNPDHLFSGTQRDNLRDMDLKGRRVALRNEDSPRCRLSNSEVESIRHRYHQGGITQTSLAREHGVSPSHISRIVRGLDRRDV